jgi:hypothetical protein
MSSIYTKLNYAREEFHSLELKKTGHNKFAQYYYFELGDFLIPALRIFKKHGLCAIVSFTKELATMTIVDVDKPQTNSGGTVNGPLSVTITSPLGSAALKGCHEIQNIGACETYCRRYLWVAALEIVEHDALDAVTGSDKKIAGPVGVMGAVLDETTPLTPEDKDYFGELAERVVSSAMNVGPGAAYDLIELEKLDNSQKIQLWTFLDSKTRSALKAEGGKRKMAS